MVSIMRVTTRLDMSSIAIARFAAFALVGFLYFFRLGTGTLWDNSEPTYGEIAKEILRTNDWLTLHLNFKPWFVHPPLWFWTAAASARVFGLDEFGLRLPSAFFGLLCVVATYSAARRLYDEGAAIVAALALGTSLELIVLSRLAILDTMLIFFITVACFAVYRAVHQGDLGSFWLAAGAAACGTLTKGPVALVIPLLVVFAYVSWTRQWAAVRKLPWLLGAALYVVAGGLWFWIETALHGIAFLQQYFGSSTVGRFLSPFENQPGPLYYYLPVMIVGFFPYVAFVPKALKEAWKQRGDAERFLLCYAGLPFVFFSLAQTKLPNYIALSYPALALLVGRLFAQAIRSNQLRPLRGALLTLPASLLFLSIALIVYGRLHYLGATLALLPSLELLGWVVVPAAVLTFAITLLSNRAWLAPLGLGAMMAAFVAALVLSALPHAERFKPMPPMAAKVMKLWRPGEPLGVMGVSGGFSLLFYTDTHGISFIDSDMSPQRFFAQRRRVLCVIRPQDYAGLRARAIRLWLVSKEQNLWLVSNRPPGPARKTFTYTNAIR